MITFEDLAGPFTKAIGKEKAESLVNEAIKKLGLEKKDSYSYDEVWMIYSKIEEENKGFIKIIASSLIEKYALERLFLSANLDERKCKFIIERVVKKVGELVGKSLAINMVRKIEGFEINDEGKVIKGTNVQNLLKVIEIFESRIGRIIGRFARETLSEVAFSFEELIKPFSKIVGIEKAEELINNTIAQLGLEKKDFYSTTEAMQIYEKIADTSKGIVKIVATNFKTMIEMGRAKQN